MPASKRLRATPAITPAVLIGAADTLLLHSGHVMAELVGNEMGDDVSWAWQLGAAIATDSDSRHNQREQGREGRVCDKGSRSPCRRGSMSSSSLVGCRSPQRTSASWLPSPPSHNQPRTHQPCCPRARSRPAPWRPLRGASAAAAAGAGRPPSTGRRDADVYDVARMQAPTRLHASCCRRLLQTPTPPHSHPPAGGCSTPPP